MNDEDKRILVGVRMTPTSIIAVDQIAKSQEWSRSQVIRKLLGLGLKAWTKGER